MKEDSESIKKGDIVWAKVKGFPWWPGEVKRITQSTLGNNDNEKEKQVTINFIGHNSHVKLPLSKVENFENKYDQYSKTRKKMLIKSIEKAKRMVQSKRKMSNKSENENCSSNSSSSYENSSSDLSCSQTPKRTIFKKLGLQERKLPDLEKITNASTFASSSKTKPKNIKINININVTNNNHNTVNISSFSKEMNTAKKETETINKSSSEKEEESESSDEEQPEEVLQVLIDNLLKYQIEMTTASSLKYIVNTLDEIKDLLDKYTFADLYSLTRDIMPLLMSFTYNKNSDVLIKSSEIISSLTQNIKKEIFDVNEDKTEFSPSQLEESPLVTKELKEELVAMLNDKSAMKKISQINSNDIDSLKQNKQKLTKRKTKRDENDNEDIDFKEIYDNFKKVISHKEEKKAMDEVKSMTEEFYKNTYNKYHGLENKLAIKRKEVCLKLFKILRKLFKRAKDEQIQKLVVFFEYQIRKQDPNLGKKYFGQIQKIIDLMKDVLEEKHN